MATTNPFDLLGDDDNDDPSLLLAAQQHKVAAVAATLKSAPAAANQAVKPAKLPTKPLPPSQAVREGRNDGGRGGGRGGGGGRGFGRGGRGGPGGFNREPYNSENTSGNDNGVPFKPSEDRERRPFPGTRGGYRGGRRGGFSNGEAGEGERPRRTYDRHSGTGRGTEHKRDGSGRGNWGSPTDEIPQETEETTAENETNVAVEKQQNVEENVDANKENPANESEEKELEELQMTLEEYEKVLEEKRKALNTLKVDERKVDTKVFESMQVISKKKDNNEIFIKLGSDKDKRKEIADKEEKAKKSVSINEFLKPAEGESFYRPGGRGRGRGRGPRGGYSGGRAFDAPAPPIADPGHFPSLGAK